MADRDTNFQTFLKNFQKNNVALSSIASKLERASDATERAEILKNEENFERFRATSLTLKMITRSEESLESFQKQAVSAGFDYEKLNKHLQTMEKTFSKISKMDIESSPVIEELVDAIEDSSDQLNKAMREVSFELMENANPLFKTLNLVNDRMENLSSTIDNQSTFLIAGAKNYHEMVDYSNRIIKLMKEKKNDLIRMLEEAPQRLESLKKREADLISQVNEITVFKELKRKQSELESEKVLLSEAPQKMEQLKERETTLVSKTEGVARLGELRGRESELRSQETQIRESSEISSEEKQQQLQAISVEMDQIQLELNTSDILREVASMTQEQVESISVELNEVRKEISKLPENEEARMQSFQQIENKLSELNVELDRIPIEVKSMTNEQIESITEELNGVQNQIAKLPKTLKEKSALANTVEKLTRSIETITDGLKENMEFNPVVQVVTEGLKPINKAMEKMSFDLAYREAAYGEIDKMGWFRVMSEISLNKKEMNLLEDQEKLLRKQLIEIDSRSDINEQEKTLMKKKTMEALENVSGEKGKRVGRGEKLEERRKQGMFVKFFEGIKKSLDGLNQRLKDAASSWITKLLMGLFVFGFLIKRGLISTSTVAKVLSFLLKLLVEGLKVAVELIFVGLGAVFGVITDLFKSGDYLGGILLTLAATLTALFVLGKAIALATSLWSGIVLGAGALKMGFNFLKDTFGVISSVWNSSFFQTARSGLLGGINTLFSGLTSAIKDTSKGAFDTIKNTLTNTFGKGLGNFFGGLLPKKKGPSLTPETPAAGPKKSIWETIGNALKSLGTTDAMRGAVTVAILASAIFIVAKAFEAFSKVSWGGVAKGFVALTSLIGITLFVKQIKNDILKGSLAIAALGAAMLGLGYGLIQFNEIGLGAIIKGLAALTALIFLARLVKEQATNVIIGAIAIGILSAALIPLGFALSLISGVGVGQILAFAIAVGVLTGIAALAGMGLPLIAAGAAAFALIGLSMLTFIPIVRSLSRIDGSSLVGFATAVGILTGIALLAGVSFLGIVIGSAALAILGAGIATAVYLIGLALKSLDGIDYGMIQPFSEGVWRLAKLALFIAPFSALIALGSLAIGLLGLAVLPFALAMNLLNGVMIDLQQIANLDEAIRILAWRAVKEAPFLPAIALGSLAMLLVGQAIGAFLPFMDFLVKTKFDTTQMLMFSQAVAILTFTAAAAGFMMIPIIFGSIALGILARALENFIPIINALRGIDGNAVTGFGLAVLRMVYAAVYAGGNLFGIYFGADALEYLGKKLTSLAVVFQYLQGVDPNSMISFSRSVGLLVRTAVFAGNFVDEITEGAKTMSLLGSSLVGFANVFTMLSKVKTETMVTFSNAVGLLTGVAINAGLQEKNMLVGSSALDFLGISLVSFANVMTQISGVDPKSMAMFAVSVRKLMETAIIAGIMFPLVMLGSFGLLMLGSSMLLFGESFGKIKGLKPEDADSFVYALNKILDFISGIGFFEGLALIGKITLLSGPLRMLGESLIPFSVAMSNLSSFDPKSLSGISDSIYDLLIALMDVQLYGDPQALEGFFARITSLGPSMELFSGILERFSSSLTTTNKELFTFASLLTHLSQLPDPLYNLALSLQALSISIGRMGDAVSDLSDEDVLRIIRLFSLTTQESTGTTGRAVATGSRTQNFMANGPSFTSRTVAESEQLFIGGEIVRQDSELSEKQVWAIDTAIKMSEKNAANYPTWVLDKYAKQKGIDRGTLPRGRDFQPYSSVKSQSYSGVGMGPSGTLDGEVSMNNEAKTLVDIRTILLDTKDLQLQNIQRGGNAIIMQNSNTNVSNSNTSQPNILRPMTPTDKFFSRMKFRHQIS